MSTVSQAVPHLSPRFGEGLQFACALHARQVRKGSGTPYISHLLSVAALVLEAGGDEDLAIAALLHDAVEDQGGLATLEQIRRRFGDRVADVVLSCSDCDGKPEKPPWKARKQAYLVHLSSATPDTLLVSAADKLHNARTLLMDYRVQGEDVWKRFNGGRETLWYYRELLQVFGRSGESPLLEELRRVVSELERLAGAPAAGAQTANHP